MCTCAKGKSVAVHYSSVLLMPFIKQSLDMLCGILKPVGKAFLIDLSLINRGMRRMLHKVSLLVEHIGSAFAAV